MKISIVVKTRSKREGEQPGDDGTLLVMVRTPPVEGRANERVIELIARHFGKPKRAVTIVSGRTAKHKIVEVS